MEEAPLVETPGGLVPAGDGWFVLNARDAPWWESEFGLRCVFEADGRVAREYDVEPRPFPQLGLKLAVVGHGQPSTLYHAETEQEDFLVLAGACTLVVEEQERELEQWDLVHCPPGTRHAFVNRGDAPCVLLMVGARSDDGSIVYPVSEVAARHGASVETETPSPHEAYAGRRHWQPAAKRNPAGL